MEPHTCPAETAADTTPSSGGERSHSRRMPGSAKLTAARSTALLANAALTSAVTSQWSRPERGPGLVERPSGASEAGVDTHQVYRPSSDSTAEALGVIMCT